MSGAEKKSYKLVRLEMFRSYDKERYRLDATFEGYGNRVSLHINDQLAEEIMTLCRDRIAEEIGNAMRESIQELIGIPGESSPQIEDKGPDDVVPY